MNIQGIGIDDPDVVFYETLRLRLGAQLHRLLQSRDREDVRPAVADVRHRGAKKLVWEIDKKLQEDGARPVIQHGQGGHLLAAGDERRQAVRQLDLQSLAFRRRVVRSLAYAPPRKMRTLLSMGELIQCDLRTYPPSWARAEAGA